MNSQVQQLRKRATMYRLRSVGCEPEERQIDLEHAKRLDAVARRLEQDLSSQKKTAK